MAGTRNDPQEQAPLLVNEEVLDDDSVDGTERQDSALSNAWNWFRGRALTIVIVLLLIGGLVALAIYFAFLNRSDSPEPQESICLSESCVIAAAQLVENLSPRHDKIDPCTNFDQYVCEGFREKHDLRADQASLFTGTIMLENAQQVLRHVLESPYSESAIDADSGDDRLIFDKLQSAYDACMDEKHLRQIGSAPLIKLLRHIAFLFPTEQSNTSHSISHRPSQEDPHWLQLSNSSPNTDSDSLSKTLNFLISIGVTSLLELSVGPDDKDPDFIVPSITAPRSPGLPSKQYYKDPIIVVRYAQVIGQVLEALLDEAEHKLNVESPMPGIANAELVEKLVHLESQLAKATPDTEDAEDVTYYYNPTALEEAESLIPQISLQKLITSRAPAAPVPSKIIVGSPHYVEALAAELREVDTETLQAYLVWKTVQAYAYKIEDDALLPLKAFNNELQGKDADAKEERWRTCVKVADDGLGWILSKFFIEKSFSEPAKHFGDHIVSDIKTQFVKKLQRAQWMSAAVRKLGIEKVHAIVQKIGYPTKSPNVRDASDLQHYYQKVNISRETYFDNALSISTFETAKGWSALGKPTDRNEWGMTADTVNAYYNPPGNEIVFPAGIMQQPVFYDPSVPQYLSYGAFGAVSGHELSHAFDSTGRHYDETGNYTDWWDPETVENFKHKAQCFIEQYSNFTVPNPNGSPLHVNGRLTLGENIADAGGLNAAFAAWKEIEKQQPSQSLPGLQQFSKEQLFFISYSNWWCGKIRPEAAVNLIYRDPHSPTWARILGTMANSRHFKEAFHCPVTEPTCELW